MWSCENIENPEWRLIGKLVHDRFTPLALLVKVTLPGLWVVRPVGADQIGHGAGGLCCHRAAVGKRRPGEMPKTPPNGKQGD